MSIIKEGGYKTIMKFTHNIWIVILIWLIMVSLPIGISKLILFITNQSIPPSSSQQTASQTQKRVAGHVATTTEEIISILPVGISTILAGSHWIPQTFNNCGPATTAMLLEHFGYIVDQQTIRKDLHKQTWDKNTFTYEIRDYLHDTYHIGSRLLYNGSVNTLKQFLANGFYVIVEDWIHPKQDIGHLILIRGFDDTKGVFIADDSFIGKGVLLPYQKFDEGQWKPFNREYLPVYLPEQEKIVKKIIRMDWDEQTMYQNAVARNQQDVGKNPRDTYAWFNIGLSYFGLDEYEKAKIAFETSQHIGWPPRMLWYQIQPIQTYNRLGEYKKALELITVGLRGNKSFADLYLESAIAYEGLGDLTRAKQEAKKAVRFAPESASAEDLLSTLQSQLQ